MIIYLDTFHQTDKGTFSHAVGNGESLGESVEQPWNNNRPFHSCVPEGQYNLIPFDSPKYGKVFLLHNPDLNVYAHKEQRKNDTDRYLCIFAHKGSYPDDFQGCIGIGDRFIESLNMVTNTRKTCAELMDKLYSMDEPHYLVIKRG